MTDLSLPVQTTVVVPVWDNYAGERLDRVLASLTDQGVAAALVLVDNASGVPVLEIDRDQTVRTPERMTLGAARNFGLAYVTTPYVVFWDADDLMFPGTLAFLEQGISATPGLVAFAAGIVEEPSGVRHRWPRRWVAALVRAPRAFALLDSVWSLYPTTGATIMRTAAVRDAGGYPDADSGEDWCLGASLAFRGRIEWSERPGRIYRIHPESVWARHMTPRHQLDHASAVRSRLRTDEAVPRLVRAGLPLIAAAQYAALTLHALLAAARKLGGAEVR